MKIFVIAKPRAKKEEVKKIDDTHYHIDVVEPPVDGEANHAIVKALAKYFNVRPNKIIMISGYTSRNKAFRIN